MEMLQIALPALGEAFGGIGCDVAMEMAGFNSSVNNALQSVRRGGDVAPPQAATARPGGAVCLRNIGAISVSSTS